MLATRFEQARQLSRDGKYADAVPLYEDAARSAASDDERARVLAHLSGALKLIGRHDDAIRSARSAHELACTIGNSSTEAHAALSLADAMLAAFLRVGPEAPDWSSFDDAMNLLDRSALLYEQLGQVDFAAALLIAGDTYRAVELFDGAGAQYQLVIRGLSDSRWASPESLARHSDYLRGRAFMGMGFVSLHYGFRDKASEELDTAVDLLLSGEPRLLRRDLEEIANVFESQLKNPERARIVRAAMRAR